jgi:hypothetical protein
VDRSPNPGKSLELQRGAREPFGSEEVNRIASDQRQTSPVIAADVVAEGDIKTLQSKYQSQLDVLAAEGIARFHFVEYAPPSLELFRSEIFAGQDLSKVLSGEVGEASRSGNVHLR